MKYILILFLFCNFALHPIHISKCDVNYNSKGKSLQVAYHIYIDDLEETLQKRGVERLFIGSNKEKPKTNEAILMYLNEKFKIQINNASIKYQLIGKELSEDKAAIWCYLEAKNIKNPKQIVLFSSVLTELYEDQKNIITFAYDNKKSKYLLFDAKKQSEIINF